MLKIKKTLASALALSLMVGTMPFHASAEAIYSTEEGYYEMDSMIAYQYKGGTGTLTDDNYSMCNGIFAAESKAVVSGDTATLYIYVCNPTPGSFGGEDEGALKDVVLNYNGTEYPGTTTSIGMLSDGSTNPAAEVKYFSQTPTSGLFGITAGDSWACDTIEIPNVPVAVLEEEAFHLTAFVNLVMKSTQDFYLVPEYVAGGPGEVPEDTGSTPDSTPSDDGTWEVEKNVQITATVSASQENAPSYEIVIPTSVALGEISSDADTTINYSIGVTDMGTATNISIAYESSGTLTYGTASLPYTNSLPQTKFTSATSGFGQITVSQADGAAATAGSYAGTMTFTITAE